MLMPAWQDKHLCQHHANSVMLCAQVRDLMVYLEAQQQVQASGEMAHGTVLPIPEPAPAPKRKGSRGRGRQ